MLDVKFGLTWSYQGKKGSETLFHIAVGSFATSLRDWGPAFQAMASEVLEPGVMAQFETMGHGTWAELAPSTIKQKGHDTILFRTGAMYRSFQSGGQDHVEEITRKRMLWGSSDPKALFHQTGTLSGFQQMVKGPGRGVPMRKLLTLDSEQKRRMRSILVQRLATIARREGFAMGKGLDLDPLSARQLGSSLLGI